MGRATIDQEAGRLVDEQPVHRNVERGKKHKEKRESGTTSKNKRDAAVLQKYGHQK